MTTFGLGHFSIIGTFEKNQKITLLEKMILGDNLPG
jgi:hypothetical protein